MGRRVAAVAITVPTVVVAGGLRSSTIEAGNQHGDIGVLGAAVALVMTAVSLAVIVGLLMPRRTR